MTHKKEPTFLGMDLAWLPYIATAISGIAMVSALMLSAH